MPFTIAERARAALFEPDAPEDAERASNDDTVERAEVFDAEGISSERQCAYFGCDEQTLHRLHARAAAR